MLHVLQRKILAVTMFGARGNTTWFSHLGHGPIQAPDGGPPPSVNLILGLKPKREVMVKNSAISKKNKLPGNSVNNTNGIPTPSISPMMPNPIQTMPQPPARLR